MLNTGYYFVQITNFHTCRGSRNVEQLKAEAAWIKVKPKAGPSMSERNRASHSKARAFLKGDESTPGSPLGVRGIGGSTCQCRERSQCCLSATGTGALRRPRILRTASENVNQTQDTKRGHDSYHMEKKGTRPVKNQHKYLTWSSEYHEAQ